MQQRPTFAVSGKRPSAPVPKRAPAPEQSRVPVSARDIPAPAAPAPCSQPTFTSAEAFPPSVVRAEGAVCAWVTLVGSASAPLSPLPVMIAALLRRPQLDVFIEALRRAADSGKLIPLHSTRENDVVLAPICREAIARRHDPTDLDHLLRSCDHESPNQFRALPYLQRLCATGDLPDAFAALAQMAPDTGPLGQNSSKIQTPHDAMLLIALYTLKPMLIARADVSGIIACVRAGYNHTPSVQTGFYPAEARLCNTFLEPELAGIISSGLAVRAISTQFFGETEAWAARARAWTQAREAALSALGDVANLVAQLPLMPSAHHWARLLGFLLDLAKKLQDPVAVMEALFAINRADVAAVLYATAPRDCAPPSTVALFNRVATQISRHELQQQMVRHSTSGCGYSLLLSAMTIELPVWNDSGDPQFTVRDTAFLDERLFLRPSDDDSHVTPGEPAVVSRSEFERRWAQLTGDVLDGFDWRNVVAAGGAVVACLDPANDVTAPGQEGRPKDVDLFVYGLTASGAKQVCCEIEVHANKVAAAKDIEYLTLVTSRTMTIIFGDEALPRVQVVLGQWESTCDLLSTADVDCCCVCYNGRDVTVTTRGLLSWTHRVNVGSDAHAAVGSRASELRLWKYARRHGFAVAAVAPSSAELAGLRNAMKARKAAAAGSMKRGLATSASGLRLVAAVDSQLLKPVTPPVQLALGTLANLRAALANLRAALEEEQGYMESDNYGQHEEGFMILQSEGPAATFEHDRTVHRLEHSDAMWPRGAFPRGQEEPYWPRHSPLQRNMLRQALKITDHDAINPDALPTRAAWNATVDSVADAAEKRR
jgi:hypothetical protein